MKRMRNPNGFGTISKLNGNRRKKWVARTGGVLQEDGTYKRNILGCFETYNDAYKALVSYNDNPINLSKSNKYTLGEAIEKFIKRKEDTITSHTHKKYIRISQNFNSLYNEKLRDIKYSQLQEIFDNLTTSNGNIAKIILNNIYENAIKEEIVNKNISVLLKTSKIKNKIIRRIVYNKELIDKIYNFSETGQNNIRDIVIFLLYTGLRPGEAIEVKKENVFINERYFIAGKKTTAGKNRIIPIHKKILPIVEFHYKIAEKHNLKYLFMYKNENYLKGTLNYFFTKFQNDLMFSNDLHSARHTFITRAKELELNPSKLMKLVGHRTTNITELVYTHYSPDTLVELIDKFEY